MDKYGRHAVRRLAAGRSDGYFFRRRRPEQHREKKYKLVKTDAEIPKEGLTELTSDSVRVDGNGVWYVYYRFYDRAGEETVGREANKTEGFVGPVRIDVTAPALTVACGTLGVPKSGGLPGSVKAEYGMSGGSVRVVGGERSV